MWINPTRQRTPGTRRSGLRQGADRQGGEAAARRRERTRRHAPGGRCRNKDIIGELRAMPPAVGGQTAKAAYFAAFAVGGRARPPRIRFQRGGADRAKRGRQALGGATRAQKKGRQKTCARGATKAARYCGRATTSLLGSNRRGANHKKKSIIKLCSCNYAGN